uniref:Large ribosomal subunit protein bL33m n=1 Tax=Astyanax mexicanus TaxID=7994 RepID=A0A8B9KKM9_ASTMX
MFLTAANLAKAKSKTLLVQMVSAAGTGYCFNTKRGRLREKLVLRKHDPFGKVHNHCGFEGHCWGNSTVTISSN